MSHAGKSVQIFPQATAEEFWFLFLSELGSLKKGEFQAPRSKKPRSLNCACSSLLSCGLSNRQEHSCKPDAWVGVNSWWQGSDLPMVTSNSREAEGQPH